MEIKLKAEIEYYKTKKNIYFKNFSKELIGYLNKRYPTLSIKAQWYLLIRDMDAPPKCQFKNCSKYASFNERTNIFNLGCSKEHNQKITFLKNYGAEHPLQNDKQKKKLKLSVKEKYGVDSIAKLDSTKEKIKKTVKEKYGVDSIAKLDSTKEKIKKTMIEKYGVEYAQQSQEIRNKTITTNLMKYGVPNPLSLDYIRKKAYDTNLKKFGTIFPIKNKTILEKRKNTIISKYDSYSAQKNPISISKIDNATNNKIFEKFKDNIFVTLIDDLQIYDSEYIYTFKCKTCNSIIKSVIDINNLPICAQCNPILDNRKNILNKIQCFLGLIGYNFKIVELDKVEILKTNIIIEILSPSTSKDTSYIDNSLNADNLDINLIQFYEYEWSYYEEYCKQIILYKLKYKIKKMDVDELEIKMIDTTTGFNFLNEHLYNISLPFTKMYGAFFNNELLAVMGISNHKKNIEIKQFAIYPEIDFNTNPFIDILSLIDKSIIVSIDRRFNLYLDLFFKINFSFEGSISESLYYNKKDIFIPCNSLDHTNVMAYIELYDNNLTIKENMLMNGFLIYTDSGKRILKKY